MALPAMNHNLLLTFALIATSAAFAATAQDRGGSPDPAFEVASVKLNPDGTAREGIEPQRNRIRFTAFPVRTLITIAYRSEEIQRFDQLIGGPSWIATERVDIDATLTEADAQRGLQNLLPAMLRSLLRDRFRLKLHAETRPMPAFALVVARRDRRLGPELHESTIDCSSAATPPDPDRRCGIRATTGGVVTGRSVPAPQLAGYLSGLQTVDRHVTDRTGLTGRYDFRLEYSPAFVQAADAVQNPGPSLFTALTEQLGLTLQPETVTLPVLVIDNIDRPTPN